MLKAEFSRDLSGSYMLLSDPETEPEDSFDLKILSTNRIPGLLPISSDRLNGCVTCRCEITGLIPFDLYWEHASGSEECVRAFFLDLIDKLLLFEDYLLDTSHLLLTSDYLYMKPDTPSLMIAYCPFTSAALRSSLMELAEHLLLLIGHRDREGVILTCRILHELRSSSTELASLKALLLHEQSGKDASQPQRDGKDFLYKKDNPGFISGTPNHRTFSESREGMSARKTDPGCPNPANADASLHTRTEIPMTAAAEIRPEPGTLKMMLFSLIPAAAIYALLHVQTMFFLETEEMIGAALLVCAAVLAILTACHPDGKSKGDKTVEGNTEEEYTKGRGRRDFVTEYDAGRRRGFDAESTAERRKRGFDSEYDAGRGRDFGMEYAAERRKRAFEPGYGAGTVRMTEPGEGYDAQGDYGACKAYDVRESLYDSLSSCPIRRPYLSPERPDNAFPEINLNEDEVVIGTSGKLATHLILDPSVSRVHARVILRDGIYFLEDLNSGKGTFVNGRLLAPKAQVPLTEGSQISFGECRYVFHA